MCEQGRGLAQRTLGAPKSAKWVPENVRLPCKKLARINTLAYSMTEKKSFSQITSTPESSEGPAQSKFFGFGAGREPWRRAAATTAAAATAAAPGRRRGTRTGGASGT
jgi:hypothetical protein